MMTIDEYLLYPTDSETSLVSGGVVRLRRGAGRELKSGGAWIYDNEIDTVSGEFENGDVLRILDFDGYFLGYGFYNSCSTIRVRMLSRRDNNIPTARFLRDRVRAAWEYRRRIFGPEMNQPDSKVCGEMADRERMTLEPEMNRPDMKECGSDSCRIIFGEADFLPGLTVDKYADILVVESLALGIDRLKTLLLASLVQILAEDGISIRGIYERSDAKVREKEGLPRTKGFLSEEFDTNVPILENGVRYLVDVKDGQKTGFFLDQKMNRLAIRPLCGGADVLDCFTHTGSFGITAAMAGAAHITSIDASAAAIEQARRNAALNGIETIDWVVGDVFDFLPQQRRAGKQYDVVILDPPAFTKSRSSVKAAAAGYREINREGMLLVRDGGYLATCSCSHFMTAELFRQAIGQAAHDAHRRLRQVEFRQQAPDHPILWANDASYYLKFYIFQVTEEK